MGLVQKLNRSNKTFGQVAELTFTDILHEGDKARELILSLMSIAQPPSNKLNESTEMPTTLSNTKPIWWTSCTAVEEFMCGSSNKTSLIRFLTEEWKL